MKEEFCQALRKALELEEEGYQVYTKCAERTNSKEGRDMFRYLAREEQDHYKKVEDIYKEEVDEMPCECKEEKTKTLFSPLGKNLDEKSDALDALSTAVEAEKKSIELYENLTQQASTSEMKKLFQQLVKEEEKHLSMLETDREFITQTGAYYDFKVVTM